MPADEKSLGAMEDGSGSVGGGKKVSRWPGLVHFIFLLTVLTCALVYAPRFLAPSLSSVAGVDFFKPRPSSLGRAASGGHGQGVDGGGGNAVHEDALVLDNQVGSPCASMPGHGICCDRTDFNTDVCFMAGDVRTDAASLSFLLFPPSHATVVEKEERVRPYTRKWERHLMERIHEVRLRAPTPEERSSGRHRCDVVHDAPALVMTAGGYTGNLFHAFNDAFLPAWLTVQHLRRRVVLAVLAYNPWWAGSFRELVSGLSDHHVVDLLHDKRTHCFPGAIVGTRFHGILAVHPERTRDNRTLADFHNFLADAYKDDDAAVKPLERGTATNTSPRRPRLGIVSRKGTRVIENEAAVAQLATSVGFDVSILETANGAPLSSEYAAISVLDVLLGVHGADLTKLLFPLPRPRRAPPGGPARRAAGRARLLLGGVRHDGGPLRAVRRGGKRELAAAAVRGGRRGADRSGEGEAKGWVGDHRARLPRRPEREPGLGQVRGHAEEVAFPRHAAAGGAVDASSIANGFAD